MTIQYEGNDMHTIYLENRSIIISKAEINEIQEFNLETERDFEKTREEMQDEIDAKDDKILELTLQIMEYEGKGSNDT